MRQSYKISKAAGSPQRKRILDGTTRVYVLEGETLSCSSLQKKWEEVSEEAKDLKATAEHLEQQIDELYAVMAEDYNTYLSVIDDQQEELRDLSLANSIGRTIDDVSPRQARRKLKQFKTKAQQALWFAELYGLIPECLQVCKFTYYDSTSTIVRANIKRRKRKDTLLGEMKYHHIQGYLPLHVLSV